MEITHRNGFKPQGVFNLNIMHAILIEISNDGAMARYCDSRYTTALIINTYGHWQEIKYTKSGKAYIRQRMHGQDRRLYLENFMRI